MKAVLIDSDEAIKRMQNVIEHYKKYSYMEEAMYRMAVGHCIAVIKGMAGNNNDTGRVHSVSSKRVLRAKSRGWGLPIGEQVEVLETERVTNKKAQERERNDKR